MKAMMLCKTQRPKYRAISFLMIVVGLALSAPKLEGFQASLGGGRRVREYGLHSLSDNTVHGQSTLFARAPEAFKENLCTNRPPGAEAASCPGMGILTF